jgi:hypothetical protein
MLPGNVAELVRCFRAHELHRSGQAVESARGGCYTFLPLTELEPPFFVLVFLTVA